jgi:hypothetical protein
LVPDKYISNKLSRDLVWREIESFFESFQSKIANFKIRISKASLVFFRGNQLPVSSVQFKSKLVLECRKLLMRLSETNSVTLIWVPGRTNVQGNKNVDELVREGSAIDFVGPEPALPLTLSRVKTTISTAAHKKHIQYWQNLQTCQHSKLFLEEPLGVAIDEDVQHK